MIGTGADESPFEPIVSITTRPFSSILARVFRIGDGAQPLPLVAAPGGGLGARRLGLSVLLALGVASSVGSGNAACDPACGSAMTGAH